MTELGSVIGVILISVFLVFVLAPETLGNHAGKFWAAFQQENPND